MSYSFHIPNGLRLAEFCLYQAKNLKKEVEIPSFATFKRMALEMNGLTMFFKVGMELCSWYVMDSERNWH